MKILKENKEKLPIEFITSFISQGWSEIGSLNTTIIDFKKNFSESSKLVKILEDLADSYLIAIGQCQLLLEKKGFELPEEEEKTENLKEEINDKSLLKYSKESLVPEIEAVDEIKVEKLNNMQESQKDTVESNSENIDDLTDFLCDFDDPVGPKPTDEEIYSRQF
jgi:hypothetical protein